MKKWTAYLALLLPVIAHSQPYSVDWFKVAGGGGFSASTDGLYSATVTIGQQDAGGPMQGPGYSVEGGFWSLYAEQQAPSTTGSAPQIVTQSQSQFVYQGNPASFNVSVTGTPPFIFQWQKNGVNLTDGGDVIGSTTSNLLFEAASPSDGGSYSVIVQDAYGSVTSSVAILTVVISVNAQNLFVSDASGKIYEFTSGAVRTTFASGLSGGSDLVFDSKGDLFAADLSGNIYEIMPTGKRSTFATGLSAPTGLAFDRNNDLFVGDSSGNIYEFAPDGTRSTFHTESEQPEALALDSAGDLFEVDDSSGNINEITNGVQGTFASGLSDPDGLAVNGAGSLFAADGSTVYEFAPNGNRTIFASGLSSLYDTTALAFDNAGDLFVPNGNNVTEITPDEKQVPFASALDEPDGIAVLPTQSTNTNLIDATYGPGSGSFELGDYNTNVATATGPQNNYGLAGGWVWSPSGNTITGWTCSSNVDWDWNRWQDADGSKDVELGGNAYAASIYTTLHLDAGITYTLNFSLSSTPTYNPGIVQVTFGAATQMFTNVAATIFTNMQWQTNTMTFTPTTPGNYQLQFYHPLFGSIPVIDAVSVNAPVQVTNQPPTIGQYVQPTIETSSASRGEFTFSWNNLPAYPPVDYQVQYTTNLLSPWINLGNVITNSVTSFTASVGSNPQGFYRVILVQ